MLLELAVLYALLKSHLHLTTYYIPAVPITCYQPATLMETQSSFAGLMSAHV